MYFSSLFFSPIVHLRPHKCVTCVSVLKLTLAIVGLNVESILTVSLSSMFVYSSSTTWNENMMTDFTKTFRVSSVIRSTASLYRAVIGNGGAIPATVNFRPFVMTPAPPLFNFINVPSTINSRSLQRQISSQYNFPRLLAAVLASNSSNNGQF